MTDRAALLAAFIDRCGWADSTRCLVAGDASQRRYERLTDATGQSVILMDAPPFLGENVQPFVRMARYLADNGLSAPEIHHADVEAGFLLLEDLGTDRFAERMVRVPEDEGLLYTAATDVLGALHRASPLALNLCDADWLTEASLLVFEWYAAGDTTFEKEAFRAVFHPLAMTLDQTAKVVILRDYHAENLLWLPEREDAARVGLLDFQDALLGHPAYDLVSILQDARRDVAAETEAEMIAHYLDQTGHDPERFQTAYALLGLQRNLRILGIFARLCLRDGKARYLDMIPRVHGHVIRNLAHPVLRPLADPLRAALPEPTPDLLQEMRRRCPAP